MPVNETLYMYTKWNVTTIVVVIIIMMMVIMTKMECTYVTGNFVKGNHISTS